MRSDADRGFAEHLDPTRDQRKHTGDGEQRGRFPRTVRSEQGHNLTVLDVEIESAHRRHSPMAGDESVDDDRTHTITSAPR